MEVTGVVRRDRAASSTAPVRQAIIARPHTTRSRAAMRSARGTGAV